MRRRATTTRRRAGALAIAGLVLMSVAGLAAAQPADAPSPPDAAFPAPIAVRRARTEVERPRAVFPVRGPVGYGESAARFGAARGGHRHEGQDIFAPAGTPLRAVRDGVVLETGDGGGRGNYVAIFSPAASQTYVYLHMQAAATVRRGQRVRAGRTVGRLGCTGSCFGDHLHFEIRRGRTLEGRAIDPLPLLRKLD
jgi:murein DD-endopeptidase MepM/ murein hydrolase activator NlpD